MEGFQLYWGDSHCNIRTFHENSFEDTFKESVGRLDFLPIAYYPFSENEWASPFLGRVRSNERGGAGGEAPNGALQFESTRNRPLFIRQWEKVQELTRSFNAPGEFVTLPGYEWHGNRQFWGDHNVFFPDEGHPLLDTWELPELFAELKKRNAIAIPHHTAYHVGERGKDWSFHDPAISPVVEIYSSHGCSESIDSPLDMEQNRNMGPRTSGGTVVEGLLRGHKFGIIASSDGHYGFAGPWGRGLMALYARELTREGILEAIRSRRAYGVTGDRIALEFYVDGHFMGEEAKDAKGAVEARWKIVGSDAIDRVELIRNGLVIHTYSHRGKWQAVVSGRMKLRLETGWGPDIADGFHTPLKRWSGSLAVSGGGVTSVEPCFTIRGNRVKLDNGNAVFELINHQRDTRSRYQGGTQSAVFEIEYDRDSSVTLQMNGTEMHLKPEELFEREHLFVDYEGIKGIVEEQFGLREEEVPNPDVFYHNAWKHRLWRAVPEAAYSLEGEFTDEEPAAGESFYYLRVIQENGQAAWSSPVWIKRQG